MRIRVFRGRFLLATSTARDLMTGRWLRHVAVNVFLSGDWFGRDCRVKDHAPLSSPWQSQASALEVEVGKAAPERRASASLLRPWIAWSN